MKKLLLLVSLLFGVPALAQNLSTVSGSNIQDLNGTKLAHGQICFTATDQQDNPISFQIGGGGQALKRGYCSAVTAGVITSFTVPNPASTLPTGIYYRVTVKDSSTGLEVLRYTQVTFAGATFNFDNYAPTNLGNFAPLTGNSVSGNLGVTGNVAATGTVTGSNIPGNIIQQIFNAGTGLTQRTAVNFFAGITCADNAGTLKTDCRAGQLNTVTFSATPTFDCSLGNLQKITLTANVTSSSLANCAAGEAVTFEVCQNATGGWSFVQPSGLNQWTQIQTTANACSAQQYTFDSLNNGFPDLMPGLTGDVTSSPGSTTTTVAKIQGTTVTGTTGTVAAVLSTSPTLVTPNIGVATATSVNKVAITAPATSATLTIANGATLTVPVTGTAATGTGTSNKLPKYTTGANAVIGDSSIADNGTAVSSSEPFTLTTNHQVFTASGTFTVPTGVTSAKFTLVGGGGAGGGSTVTISGGGGGAGGSAVKWLTGLTPANTIAVTVGTGGTGVSGAGGNNGSASSIASGTQTITTVTANGGNGGGATAATSAGGNGAAVSTNGDINNGGGGGGWSNGATGGGHGGASMFGGGAAGAFSGAGTASTVVGAGGSGAGAAGNAAGGNGKDGIVIVEWTN